MNVEYTHWEEYYKNSYSLIFEQSQAIYSKIIEQNGGDTKTLIDATKDIFQASCYLLNLYLCNNGFFQTESRNIIKHAFFVNFLTDGDEWIEMGDLLYSDMLVYFEDVIEFIIKKFFIFEKLKNKFDCIFNKNEPIIKSEVDVSNPINEKIKYLKIDTFNFKVNYFKALDGDFTKNDYEEKYIMPVFTALKSVYTFYYKYVKFLLKQKGINLTLPRQILEKGQNEGIITDSEGWFLYIDYMNVYYQNKNEDNVYKMMLEIVNKFKQLVYDAYVYVNNEETKKFLNDHSSTFTKYQQEGLQLANNKPVYNYEYWGISEKSYNRILDFFRSKKNLKNAWLRGSRAYDTYAAGSDLDLIVDYPEKDYQNFIDEFQRLTIPYIPDCKNINIKNDLYHIKGTQNMGTKKVYCACDF